MSRLRRVMVTALALAGCARPLPPPGGERDELAPQVVGTTPEPLSIIEPTDDPVVFRFDATLSEQGIADAIALISPRTGDARVERDGSVLRIFIEGGWRPGLVYRVVVLPGVQDRFRNQRRTPAELVFSTGPEIPSGAIAGLVLDRITGNPAQDVVVEGRIRGDTLAFLTVPDSGAFFALQYLPTGAWQVRAFQDRNRNRELDEGEASGESPLLPLNRANDTLTTVLQVVPFDTVAPRVQSARVVDSLQVRVTTDDYLDPSAEIELVEAELYTLPDTVEVEGTIRILSPMAFDSLEAAAAAAADTVPPDSAQAAEPQLPPRRSQAADPDAEPRPYQEFVVIPPVPLVPGTRYELRLEGLTNISGRSGGGGSVTFEVPERPPPTPPDTTAGRLRRP